MARYFLAKNSLQNDPPRPAGGWRGHGRPVSVRRQRFGIGPALRTRRAQIHTHAAAGMKRSLAPGYERVRLQEEAARPHQAGVPGRLDPAAPGGRPTTFRGAPWRGSCRNAVAPRKPVPTHSWRLLTSRHSVHVRAKRAPVASRNSSLETNPYRLSLCPMKFTACAASCSPVGVFRRYNRSS